MPMDADEKERRSDVTVSPSSRHSPTQRVLGSKEKRDLMDRLSAQQTSLVRSVALGAPEYLSQSYYLDSGSGKRIAHELEADELMGFVTGWGAQPMECIRAVNEAVSRITERGRLHRYVKAAVELEIVMDRQTWLDDGVVHRGLPAYLMHGYTDMGSHASTTERAGREKIKVDKASLVDRLSECKQRGVTDMDDLERLLGWYYARVRRDIEFDESGVEKLSREFGNESIVLTKYLEKGMGVCRHLSIFFQLYLQEAGIECRVVKGDLRFYIFKGRHAWNLVRVGERVILIDVTHPNMKDPFMVFGTTEEEVYERAKEHSREYVSTPDDQNYYKIGATSSPSA